MRAAPRVHQAFTETADFIGEARRVACGSFELKLSVVVVVVVVVVVFVIGV